MQKHKRAKAAVTLIALLLIECTLVFFLSLRIDRLMIEPVSLSAQNAAAIDKNASKMVAVSSLYPRFLLDGNLKPQTSGTSFSPSEKTLASLTGLLTSYSKEVSFALINPDDMSLFEYQGERKFASASTIKAPYAFYLCKLMIEGTASHTDLLQYTKEYVSEGTGVLKNEETGGFYSLETLLYDMLHWSDNAAYKMLVDYYGRAGFNDWLRGLGIETLSLEEGKYWPTVTSKELAVCYLSFYQMEDTSARQWKEWMLSVMEEARGGYIYGGIGKYPVAHKGGWMKNSFHDAGIVFSNNPYILVILTESDGTETDKKFFYQLSGALDRLLLEYQDSLRKKQAVFRE